MADVSRSDSRSTCSSFVRSLEAEKRPEWTRKRDEEAEEGGREVDQTRNHNLRTKYLWTVILQITTRLRLVTRLCSLSVSRLKREREEESPVETRCNGYTQTFNDAALPRARKECRVSAPRLDEISRPPLRICENHVPPNDRGCIAILCPLARA